MWRRLSFKPNVGLSRGLYWHHIFRSRQTSNDETMHCSSWIEITCYCVACIILRAREGKLRALKKMKAFSMFTHSFSYKEERLRVASFAVLFFFCFRFFLRCCCCHYFLLCEEFVWANLPYWWTYLHTFGLFSGSYQTKQKKNIKQKNQSNLAVTRSMRSLTVTTECWIA